MPDSFVVATRRIASDVLEYIRRTEPAGAPAYRWVAAAADRRFEALALELFEFQYAANPPYQALCRSRGVHPGAVGSWKDIPAVATAAFKEFPITCLPADARTRVFHSSGTTLQQPGRNFHHAESLVVYEASLLPWFSAHVLAPFAADAAARWSAPNGSPAVLSLTPPAACVPHSSLVHMFDTVVRQSGAPESIFAGCLDAQSAWAIDYGQACSALQKAVDEKRPVIVVGTAFNFVQLLDHLAAKELAYALAAGSRVLETGGYKGRTRVVPKSELHALITRYLGILPTRIGCEYGMCELASQAYDRPDVGDRRFHFPPWARVRVVSPETGREVSAGQPGVLHVCDLANISSVVAIQTGDLGVGHSDGSFELLGRSEMFEPKGCSLNTDFGRRTSSE